MTIGRLGKLGLIVCVVIGVPIVSYAAGRRPAKSLATAARGARYAEAGRAGYGQSEDSEDWQGYTNTLYGYSFSYPRASSVAEVGQASGRARSSWQAVYLLLPRFHVEILAYENRGNLTGS